MDLDSRESFKTRDRDVPTPFHPLRVTRRRPTVTSARCVLPRVFWAPWSRTFAFDPRWPRTVRGRCSTSTSATDSQRHVHPAESFDARGARPRLRGGGTPVGDESPASNPSREAFDDAPRASVVELHVSLAPPFRMGTTDTGEDPSFGAPIEGPWVCAPEHAALSSARWESPLPLTPCGEGDGHRGAAADAGFALPLAPVKERGSERSRTPSIDECPLDPALARLASNADPPPIPRFCHLGPASNAPSPSRPLFWRGGGARPRRYPCSSHRALVAKRRSSTSAIESIRKHDRRTFDTRPGFARSACAVRRFPGRSADFSPSIPACARQFGDRGVEFLWVRGLVVRMSSRSSSGALAARWLVTEALPQPN